MTNRQVSKKKAAIFILLALIYILFKVYRIYVDVTSILNKINQNVSMSNATRIAGNEWLKIELLPKNIVMVDVKGYLGALTLNIYGKRYIVLIEPPPVPREQNILYQPLEIINNTDIIVYIVLPQNAGWVKISGWTQHANSAGKPVKLFDAWIQLYPRHAIKELKVYDRPDPLCKGLEAFLKTLYLLACSNVNTTIGVNKLHTDPVDILWYTAQKERELYSLLRLFASIYNSLPEEDNVTRLLIKSVGHLLLLERIFNVTLSLARYNELYFQDVAIAFTPLPDGGVLPYIVVECCNTAFVISVHGFGIVTSLDDYLARLYRFNVTRALRKTITYHLTVKNGHVEVVVTPMLLLPETVYADDYPEDRLPPSVIDEALRGIAEALNLSISPDAIRDAVCVKTASFNITVACCGRRWTVDPGALYSPVFHEKWVDLIAELLVEMVKQLGTECKLHHGMRIYATYEETPSNLLLTVYLAPSRG